MLLTSNCMTIKLERVVELIEQHDKNPDPKLGGLNFYVTLMKIVLENEGTDLKTWDDCYTDEMREDAFKRVNPIIRETIAYKNLRGKSFSFL